MKFLEMGMRVSAMVFLILFISGSLAQPPSSDTEVRNPGGFAFARIFGDSMVLQAGQPVRVWGVADA